MESESERLERWRKEDRAYMRSAERAADKRWAEQLDRAVAQAEKWTAKK